MCLNVKASAISSVVTSIYRSSASRVYVTSGAHDIRRNDEGTQTIGAQRIFVHPGYNGRSLTNDFALIKLSSPVSYNDKVGVITLYYIKLSTITFYWWNYAICINNDGAHLSKNKNVSKLRTPFTILTE